MPIFGIMLGSFYLVIMAAVLYCEDHNDEDPEEDI
jgi:hypothetical protein